MTVSLFYRLRGIASVYILIVVIKNAQSNMTLDLTIDNETTLNEQHPTQTFTRFPLRK